MFRATRCLRLPLRNSHINILRPTQVKLQYLFKIKNKELQTELIKTRSSALAPYEKVSPITAVGATPVGVGNGNYW